MDDARSIRFGALAAVPNLLTLGRICLAPLLVVAVLDDRYRLAFALFIVAGLTDAFDGMLARLLSQRTQLGAYLDPVADKLLLSTLFLVLTHKGLIPEQVTALVFGRDLGILLVAALLYAALGRKEFPPSLLGKANTVTQVAAVAAALYLRLDGAPWVVACLHTTLLGTVVLTVLSGLHYAWMVARRTTTRLDAARS